MNCSASQSEHPASGPASQTDHEAHTSAVKGATIHELVRQHARATPGHPALVFEERVTSYGDLELIADRVAAALIANGVGPGGRVAYLGKNTDRYFALLLGVLKARAILVPINWRLAHDEIAFVLADCTPTLLFVSAEFEDTAVAVTGSSPIAQLVAVERLRESSNLEDFEAFLASGAHTGVPEAARCDDVILIMYTSGTTGRPKGAMLTHRSLLRLENGRMAHDPEWFRWHAGESALIAMPVFHIGGTGQGLRALRGGSRVVVERDFEVERVLEAVARYRIGKLFVVPAALRTLIRHPRLADLDLSCLECVLYGASLIAEELLEESMRALKCGFVQMYGMTETSGTVTALSPEDHRSAAPERRRSAGRPLPGVEIAILDEGGTHLPHSAIGEIAVRSSANMVGYWNRPEATREVMSADGFLRSGDAGCLDAAGYLYVHDRVKDMINSGGENVYPAEVERVLALHPDVADVAVIGVPSVRWGEEVKAVVVARPGAVLDGTTLIGWARGRIAGYKLPKSVEFVASLPRTASGKVLRRELREQYRHVTGESAS